MQKQLKQLTVETFTPLTVKELEEIKQREKKKRRLAKDTFRSILNKEYTQTELGRGQEFQVLDFNGLKYGVVLKKQHREIAPKTTKEGIKIAKGHIMTHKQWEKTGLAVPRLLATQLRLGKRPVYVFEKVTPFVRTDFRTEERKIVAILNKKKHLSVEDVCKAMPGIVRQFKKAEKNKIILDSILENWGISESGIVYLDTFHPYDRASEWIRKARPSFELKENTFRFLGSCREYFSREQIDNITKSLVLEIDKQFGSGRAKHIIEWLQKSMPSK
jgi:ribosomal protein L9